MANDIQVGAVVKLKSGSPLMTVTGLLGSGKTLMPMVRWERSLHLGFPADALTIETQKG